MDVELRLAAVGQDGMAAGHEGQLQFSRHLRPHGQEAVVAGVDDGFDVPRLPRGAAYGQGDDRLKGGVDNALDHPALRRELPPKL